MIAAASPTQRTQSAKLLVVDCLGELHHAHRDHLADFLRPGDLVIANDAATLPASLAGTRRPARRSRSGW
jgi:S-adenosylmethionine:tRNA ribosyltransferase-isomerase